MPVDVVNGSKTWQRRTSAQQWAMWLAWLALVGTI